MKLYLIRHGQTDWNVQARIQGRKDIPLNSSGRLQAAALARAMEKRPVTAIYSSPQIRAMETARAIGAAQGVPVVEIPQLVEIGYGEWEGRSVQDILTTDRDNYEAWEKHPATVAPPGGETLNQVDGRCRQAWERIRREIKGDTALVAHGGTLAHFIVHLMAGQSESRELVVSNASVTTMEYDPQEGTCRLVSLDDVSHLS